MNYLHGRNQNLRILSVISHFTICVKREFLEWQFSLFFFMLREKFTNFWVISCEIYHIFHILELKWNVIPRNAKNCFQSWIFHEREFTDPSLKSYFYLKTHYFSNCLMARKVSFVAWFKYLLARFKLDINVRKRFIKTRFRSVG